MGGLDEPLMGGGPKGTSSLTASAVVLFKAVVGTGIFALPPAIRASGWVLGSGLVILVAALSAYTMWLVVASVQELRNRGFVGAGGTVEFQDMTKAAYPRLHLPIIISCLLANLGAIIGFQEFSISNLMAFFPGSERWHVTIGIGLFVAPLSLLRSTTHPIFHSAMMFGNLAVALAASSVLYFGLTKHTESLLSLTAVDSGGLGLTFGVCIFMFAAHMEIVSIEQVLIPNPDPNPDPDPYFDPEQDMRDKSKAFTLVWVTFLFLTLLHLAFGVLVFSAFGEATGRVWQVFPPSCSKAVGPARPVFPGACS